MNQMLNAKCQMRKVLQPSYNLSIYHFTIGLYFLFSILFFTSCKTTLQIDRHPESYNPGNINLKYSNINVPVELDSKNLEMIINRQFAGLIYVDSSFEDNNKDNLMLKAWKTGDLKLSINKSDLYYKVPIRVWINKKFEISSFGLSISDAKEVTAEILLRFKTHLTLNKNWTFSTYTISDGYEWISSPQLKLGPVSLPITYLADVLIQSNQKTINKEIDKSLGSLLDLRQNIAKVWTDLQKPIKVSDEYKMWAKITPVELSTVPLSGNTTGVFSQSLGIKALTELYWGDEPEYTVNSTLPEIKILSVLDDNFNINIPIDIPFQRIKEVAKQQLVGFRFTQGHYSIKVDDLDIYGDDENLVVAAKVSGSVAGTIYLEGKPEYDKDSSVIRLSNLDFDLKTKNVLHKTASWVFKHDMVKTMEKKLVFPIGSRLRQTTDEVNKYLRQNRKLEAFTVSGSIQKLDLDGIVITKKSVKVLVILKGKLTVKVNGE